MGPSGAGLRAAVQESQGLECSWLEREGRRQPLCAQAPRLLPPSSLDSGPRQSALAWSRHSWLTGSLCSPLPPTRKPLIACVEKQLLGEHLTAILQKGRFPPLVCALTACPAFRERSCSAVTTWALCCNTASMSQRRWWPSACGGPWLPAVLREWAGSTDGPG